MTTGKAIALFAVSALVLWAGAQVTRCIWANAALREDLVDLSSQAGTHIGLTAPTTDDQLRAAVIQRAEAHGIQLDPQKILVTRDANARTIYLAAPYDARIDLALVSFALHFTPSSKQ
jgi:hypothetical protein